MHPGPAVVRRELAISTAVDLVSLAMLALVVLALTPAAALVPAALLVGFVRQVGQRPRVVARALERGAAEGLERLERHDPWRDGGGEALGEEGPERLVLPGLHVARRPVVQEYDAEDVIERVADAHGLAERVARPDDEAELDLVVEALRRAEAGRGGVGSLRLAVRAHHRRAGDDDGGGAAVVADRHPLVVGQQRRVGAEHLADRVRVVDAGVEVAVVAHLHGQEELGLLHRHEVLREALGLPGIGEREREDLAQLAPCRAPGGGCC